MDPQLRNFMLGNKNAGAGIETLRILAEAGITLNCQIVCCPGINDGVELEQTMEGLAALAPYSVSVVPVGLTKHRRGLVPLRAFDTDLALETVRQVERWGRMCLDAGLGTRVFYCADELYIKAGLELSDHEFYCDYPQLENGVGMMRLLITEFEYALAESTDEPSDRPFSVATGTAAAKYLTNLLYSASEKYGSIESTRGTVYAIENGFFGDSVTVSGLITGGDLMNQLKGKDLGERLLIPGNMLRRGEDVFLDDVTLGELSAYLQIPVRVVEQNGADLLWAFLGG